jgi:hypothetical protein
MTQSSGDDPSRRQDDIEPDRDEAADRAPDRDVAGLGSSAPAAAPDADSAAPLRAGEPAGRPPSEQKAEPGTTADGAGEDPAREEPAEPAGALPDAEGSPDAGPVPDAEGSPDAEPAPEATAGAVPEPEPEVGRDSEPAPAPEATEVVEPEPEPEVARDSEPAPEPEPTDVVEAASEPEAMRAFQPESEPAAARESEREPELESEREGRPELEPAPFSLFEPVAGPPPPLAPLEHDEEPAPSEERQFIDLTTVEPPEPVAPSGRTGPGEGDPTVVVITEPTLREADDDDPEEDIPPPLPAAETVPPYVPPVYAHPPYTQPPETEPAYADRGYADSAYTSGGHPPSASGPVSPEYEGDLGPPGAPGTDGVPLLAELPDGWQAVRRRHLRQTVTFVVALLGVLGLGALAGLMYTGRVAWPFGGRVNVSTQVCTPSAPLPPKQIHVRVYNGSSRAGLAKTVAAQLKALGFVVQETGNDPLESKVTAAVEIRFGEAGELAGKTASAYFAGKTRQRTDDRTNQVVDVVLGPRFKRLNTRRETNRALNAARPNMPLSCPPGVTPPPTPTPTPTPAKKARPTPTPTR